MKKMVFVILLCGVLILTMTGCVKTKNKLDIGNKSNKPNLWLQLGQYECLTNMSSFLGILYTASVKKLPKKAPIKKIIA